MLAICLNEDVRLPKLQLEVEKQSAFILFDQIRDFKIDGKSQKKEIQKHHNELNGVANIIYRSMP